MPVRDPLLIDWKHIHELAIKALSLLDILPDEGYVPEGPARQILRGIGQNIIDLIKEPGS